MSRLPFFTKIAQDGRKVELFLDSYCGEWNVEARVNNEIQWHGDDEPARITDADRRRYKKPPPREAVLGVRGLLFREPDATAIEEAWARVKAEAEAARAQSAATLEPTGYLFELGCDRASTWRVLFPDDTDLDVQEKVEERLQTELIQKHLEIADVRRIADETDAESIEPNLGIYWGCRFSRTGFDRLLALALERQAAVDAASAAKKAAREADRAAKIAQARATGKPVSVESWTEDCDGSVDECSTDIIERLAHPDGTIATRRIHTH